MIEEGGLKILTDPGVWTVEEQSRETGIDLILITHEHPDHLHTDSLKRILENSPGAKVITNSGVGKILQSQSIGFELLEDGHKIELGGIKFSGHGKEHAEIYKDFGLVQNTGFFIGERLFYPGDSFFNPGLPVEILALPIEGPWMAIREALDYALKIRPRTAFPVHDGMLKSFAINHKLAGEILPEQGIDFHALNAGDQAEF